MQDALDLQNSQTGNDHFCHFQGFKKLGFVQFEQGKLKLEILKNSKTYHFLFKESMNRTHIPQLGSNPPIPDRPWLCKDLFIIYGQTDRYFLLTYLLILPSNTIQCKEHFHLMGYLESHTVKPKLL